MAVDLAGEFLRGYELAQSARQEKERLGAQAAQANADAQQKRQQLQQESAARQQQLESETLRALAQIQTSQAYHNEQVALRQRALDQQAAVASQRATAAAQQIADQKGFAADLASGMPVEQALYRHPRLSTPQAVESAAKAKEAAAATADRLNNAHERLRQSQERIDAAKNKTPAVPKVSFSVPTGPDGTGTMRVMQVPINSDLINKYLGTNAPPGMGKPEASPTAAPAAGQVSAPASGKQGQQTVATPTTQQDFDALPAGAIYVNPSDGKKYRKKPDQDVQGGDVADALKGQQASPADSQ